jgi:branched-chain amino acid transport system substrate-binding protein
MKRKSFMKSLMAGLLVILMAAMTGAVSGCSSGNASDTASSGTAAAAASEGTIKIGASFPLTGTVAADGKYIVDSIKFAVDQCNEAGGINGRQVEVVAEDDEADPSSAASIANKFAENKDIMAVVTSYNSSCALAQVPVYKQAGLPAISPVSTSPDLTGASDYFFRTCASDAYVGKLGADYSADLGWKKVALLYEQDDYGLGISKKYEEEAKSKGIEIGYTGTFVYGETKDFSTILTSIKEAGVDGIFICGLVTETCLIANQADTLGVGDVPICGADGLYSPALISEGGAAVEGIYTLGAFTPDNQDPAVQKFVTSYKGKYGSDPSNWAALAYDATNIVLEAMKSCKTIDRESIKNAIAGISYTGVTGLNKFVKGDVEKEYLKFVVKNGKFEIYK